MSHQHLITFHSNCLKIINALEHTRNCSGHHVTQKERKVFNCYILIYSHYICFTSTEYSTHLSVLAHHRSWQPTPNRWGLGIKQEIKKMGMLTLIRKLDRNVHYIYRHASSLSVILLSLGMNTKRKLSPDTWNDTIHDQSLGLCYNETLPKTLVATCTVGMKVNLHVFLQHE